MNRTSSHQLALKTKPRGLRRHCRTMVKRFWEATQNFPQPHQGAAFWHLHLPASRGFIDSIQTPFGIRRLCVETIIDCAHYLSSVAPKNNSTRVVAAISLPDLYASQIIVFFGASYFDSFFDRDSAAQKWTRLEPNRSLVREWNLWLPDGFSERGCKEELSQPELVSTGEFWFIGELADAQW